LAIPLLFAIITIILRSLTIFVGNGFEGRNTTKRSRTCTAAIAVAFIKAICSKAQKLSENLILWQLNDMSNQETTLFWIFVAIFSITAVITLLGITGVIKTIKEKYLNALFTALILEVIAAVILLFQQVNLNDSNDYGPCLDDVVKRAGLAAQLPEGVDVDDYLVAQLESSKELPSLKTLKDSLVKQLQRQEVSLRERKERVEELEREFNIMGQKFYSKITRLHDLIPTFGKTINLAWEYQDGSKDEVYELLIGVFGEMGLINDLSRIYNETTGEKKINYKGVQSVYLSYRKQWNFPSFEDAGVYLDEADVVHFLQTYLNKE
jgi:uncharacterized membrane protein YecN with MAPEG domain